MSRRSSPAPLRRCRGAAPLRRCSRRRHLRVREYRGRAAGGARRQASARRSLARRRPGPGGREALHRALRRRRSRRGAKSSTLGEVEARSPTLGTPLVLKSRRYGYDGKGQAWVRAADGAAAAWAAIGEQPAVAEAGIAFDAEFSVLVARWDDGRHAVWDCPRTSIATASCAARPFPPGPKSPPMSGAPRHPRWRLPKRSAMSAC